MNSVYDGINEKYKSCTSEDLEILVDDTVLKAMWRLAPVSTATYDETTDTITTNKIYSPQIPFAYYDPNDCCQDTLEITFTVKGTASQSWSVWWVGFGNSTYFIQIRQDTSYIYGNNAYLQIGATSTDPTYPLGVIGTGEYNVKFQLTKNKVKVWIDDVYKGEYTHYVEGLVSLYLGYNVQIKCSNVQLNWV